MSVVEKREDCSCWGPRDCAMLVQVKYGAMRRQLYLFE